MPRYVAFLRAINVGGHVVKMERLRALFGELGFESVETFIASGNVIFAAPEDDTRALEARIEEHLRQALGYDAETFLRSTAEIARIAEYRPFSSADMDADGTSLYVLFLREAPRAGLQEDLTALRTPVDELHLDGREIYWLVRGKITDSAVPGALLGRTIGMPATARNITTVRRLAKKYAAL